MKPKTKKQEPLGRASSLKHAAAIMNETRATLIAAKNAGCPGFDDHHRVDCDIVREWLADPKNLGSLKNPESRKANAVARHEEAKVERIEFRNEVERKKFIKTELVVARNSIVIADAQKVLRAKIENEFPTVVFGNKTKICPHCSGVINWDKETEESRKHCRVLVDQIYLLMQPLVKEWKEVQ